MAASVAVASRADGDSATIQSVPSPAVATDPVTITIQTSNYGNTVYVYSWATSETSSYEAAKWGDTNVDQYRMTGNNGTYTYTIDNIKDFYHIKSDADLAKLTKLNFIAKSSSGSQTEDLSIDVISQKYSGGKGTEANPYQIATSSDLKELSETPADWISGKYFKVTADISAKNVVATIGNTESPFKGVFDGNGKTINNIVLSGTEIGEATGLFGVVDGGSIHDLGVVDATVSGTTFTGILAGRVISGTVERCYSSGTVTASSICAGGLIGENDGEVANCYSVASVMNLSDYATGGLVGKNTGTITSTIASGQVAGHDYVGGLVGANYGSVSKSVAVNSMITSQNNYVARFGGNNNSQNTTDSNHSWDLIPAGHSSWTSHGDHATQQVSNALVLEDGFRSLMEWDFDNTWKWQIENGRGRSVVSRQGPVLQSLGDNQPIIFPDEFYSTVSGVEEITGVCHAGISVMPNPVEATALISSSSKIMAVALYSMNGGLIMRQAGEDSSELSLDMSAMDRGIYLMEVSLEEGLAAVVKVIKK